ncbi:helix-turn-helix domain-containing protein [Vallitalea sp.]|jgi:transcriptional regulator with XRE-family HTH domain|uniref:helix-turn-helix domain-containing protein n=1 Tax=Vallitalea sp. TaxID=1882829 RepID=UPI0025D32E8C|nr:helix-turn-helix domain-containing protein [Vallitalea sp.]MCT4686550.1 helix-turn-helix domain-containing protein [Vallitalea sp.]
MPNFSNRLRILRKNKEMTQEELGEIVGKTKNNISQYERNARQADDETKIQFAKFFDVSMDYLMGLTDNPTPISELCHFVDVDKELKRFINNVENLHGLRFGNKPMLDRTRLIITKSLKHTNDIAEDSIKNKK